MKLKLLVLLFTISTGTYSQINYDNLQDLSGGITEGYGAWGDFDVIEEAGINVPEKGIITFYHPDTAVSNLPAIFFISGWGREASTYEKFFYFLASKGYSVVNIYNFDPGNIVDSYQNSLDMMLASANTHYPDWIDTSKIGLMGHSYGAGATIWLGNEIFSDTYNWGTDGRFIFMTAPWYSLLVTEEDLFNYPENVKLVIEINDDDFSSHEATWNTDERAIRAVFELINIPNTEKDFIRVNSDPATYEYDGATYSYTADHFLSYTGTYTDGDYKTWDALDVYAINRISDALIDYTFNGSETGKEMALGNGNTAQTDMGFLTDLYVTDAPVITKPEAEFHYKCNDTWHDFATGDNTWFLQEACADEDEDGIIDMIASVHDESQMNFSLYPIPATNTVRVRTVADFNTVKQIEIRDTSGRLVLLITQPISNHINLSHLVSGNYFIKIQTETQVGVRAFIVK